MVNSQVDIGQLLECIQIVYYLLPLATPTNILQQGASAIHADCKRNISKLGQVIHQTVTIVVQFGKVGNIHYHHICFANVYQVVQHLPVFFLEQYFATCKIYIVQFVKWAVFLDYLVPFIRVMCFDYVFTVECFINFFCQSVTVCWATHTTCKIAHITESNIPISHLEIFKTTISICHVVDFVQCDHLIKHTVF